MNDTKCVYIIYSCLLYVAYNQNISLPTYWPLLYLWAPRSNCGRYYTCVVAHIVQFNATAVWVFFHFIFISKRNITLAGPHCQNHNHSGSVMFMSSSHYVGYNVGYRHHATSWIDRRILTRPSTVDQSTVLHPDARCNSVRSWSFDCLSFDASWLAFHRLIVSLSGLFAKTPYKQRRGGGWGVQIILRHSETSYRTSPSYITMFRDHGHHSDRVNLMSPNVDGLWGSWPSKVNYTKIAISFSLIHGWELRIRRQSWKEFRKCFLIHNCSCYNNY